MADKFVLTTPSIDLDQAEVEVPLAVRVAEGVITHTIQVSKVPMVHLIQVDMVEVAMVEVVVIPTNRMAVVAHHLLVQVCLPP